MTFLNPALLWGLLALAVPIIVHFFNLQRPREVLFSNVALVKEVQNTVVRRVKFQRWLLLLLRLLAVAAIVLAFANPVIIEPGTASLQGNRSVAIVIDNSYSMTAGNEKGEYFQQGISLARNIIRAYGRQDEFLVMGTADLKLNYNFSGPEQALEGLRDLEVRQNVRSQGEILSLRDDIFSRASNRVREIYFLSDFQEATVMADSQQVAMDDSSLLIKYIPLATREQQNVYPEEHEVQSQVLERGQPVSLAMTLVNDGNNVSSDLSIRVVLEGKAAAIDNTSIDPEESRRLELTFTPTNSGWLSGYIELDDNPIDFDNRRYFSVYVPEKEKVLVVEGQTSPNLRILFETLFAEQFDATFTSFRNLSTLQLSEFRSIILVGGQSYSSGLRERLKAFVEEGGSVMFFPGDGLNLSSSNALLADLGVGSFSEVITLPSGQPASNVDLQHPIFSGVFSRSQDRRSFDAPTVFRYHPLRLQAGRVQNKIISLENQDPILVESRLGEGLMLTFTLFPGDSWTDLQVKSIFTPLIFRATQVMNQTQNVQQGQEIGSFEPKRVRTTNSALINLVSESGEVATPEQYSQGGVTMLNFEQMDLEMGNYDLVQEGELLEKISFNISDQESKLGFIPAAELGDELVKMGYSGIEVLEASPASVSSRIETEKTGTPLWKYFIVAALLFLAAEIATVKWAAAAKTKSEA